MRFTLHDFGDNAPGVPFRRVFHDRLYRHLVRKHGTGLTVQAFAVCCVYADRAVWLSSGQLRGRGPGDSVFMRNETLMREAKIGNLRTLRNARRCAYQGGWLTPKDKSYVEGRNGRSGEIVLPSLSVPVSAYEAYRDCDDKECAGLRRAERAAWIATAEAPSLLVADLLAEEARRTATATAEAEERPF